MGRNLVIGLDGTRNEPESGASDVARRYVLALKGVDQVVALKWATRGGGCTRNGIGWAVLGAGWHRRTIRPGDESHPSVLTRVDLTRDDRAAYTPDCLSRRRTPGS